MGTKHYIAMSGMHGCLPDFCTACSTKGAAIETLIDLHTETFGCGETMRRELRTNGYAELRGIGYGADYCEVISCACDTPHVHCDDGYVD